MHVSRRILWAAWTASILAAPSWPASGADTTSTSPASAQGAARLDEEVFRRGLRERGLFELLESYGGEQPTSEETGQAVRRREAELRR